VIDHIYIYIIVLNT